MKVAIIGFGFVGKAMHKLFPDATIYDPSAFKSLLADDPLNNNFGLKEDINKCDIVFIGVPTPTKDEGELDTSIVEECVAWCEASLIVVRSTVNPGDCDKWSAKYKKHIVMQPEYLGETPNHPLLDLKTRPFLIIGGEKDDRRKLIDLYTTVYNANVNIRQVTALEAEIIKLSENRAIAFKVAECQELFDVCEKAGVDYYSIRDAVYGDDPRFNLWWSFIFSDNRCINSKCLPKDVYAWASWAESLGYEPKITRAILEKNKTWIESNEKN